MSDEVDVKAVHDLAVSLRNDGYEVGLDAEDIVEDFNEHVENGRALLDEDDLSGYFVVAHREGQTDYASSVIVEDSVAYGIVQIEMLGAHFRTVLEALPMNTSELVDAMVDEAITIDTMDGGGDE
jgi:gamma-glutamyltranspeptidase